jgi:rod shape-determining protein MreD
VKLTSVLATVLIAVVLQVTLARYTAGGAWAFDLVVVGVVFTALHWGPVSGILSGTLGGLTQDMLAGDIVGVGGLAKTLVGFLCGVVGTNFVLVRPSVRAVIVAAATVIHRLIVMGLHGLIDQQWPGVPWGAFAGEVAINSVVALIAFNATGALPGMMARQRMNRRSSLSRRQW